MDDEVVSKTKRKQEMTELQSLGAKLVELPESQIAELPMEEKLREAVLEAKRITIHEAKRRQMQYVGKLMRQIDPAPLRERLEAITGHSARAAAQHRRLEAWRERLLADDAALTAFAAEHPDADLQGLRTLIRNTRKEQKEAKPPRSYRELFRLIKECSGSNPS
jgi:ribosome-associated protein